MTFEIWLTFILAASLVLVIPGPTNVYVISQSMHHGKKASLPLLAGVILGDSFCISLSLIGVTALLSFCSAIFEIIKYCGSAYLIYLGLNMLFKNRQSEAANFTASYRPKTIFRDILLVNSLNPKGIIFYSAFMPQFVNPQQGIAFQFAILSATFIMLALLNVLGYALLADRARSLLQSNSAARAFDISGGMALIGAGLYSATIARK